MLSPFSKVSKFRSPIDQNERLITRFVDSNASKN